MSETDETTGPEIKKKKNEGEQKITGSQGQVTVPRTAFRVDAVTEGRAHGAHEPPAKLATTRRRRRRLTHLPSPDRGCSPEESFLERRRPHSRAALGLPRTGQPRGQPLRPLPLSEPSLGPPLSSLARATKLLFVSRVRAPARQRIEDRASPLRSSGSPTSTDLNKRYWTFSARNFPNGNVGSKTHTKHGYRGFKGIVQGLASRSQGAVRRPRSLETMGSSGLAWLEGSKPK